MNFTDVCLEYFIDKHKHVIYLFGFFVLSGGRGGRLERSYHQHSVTDSKQAGAPSSGGKHIPAHFDGENKGDSEQ